MKNRIAYLVDKKKFKVEDAEMPEMNASDVLVEVKHIGVCGSDKPLFMDPTDPHCPFDIPMVLGHEAAGVVVDVGEKVKGIKVGDKVCFEPAVPCGHCKFCKEGRYNLCDNLEFMGPPKNNGCLQKYVAHPEDMVFKLPENMGTEQGALIEPLAVAMHAVNRANVKMGDTVVILGCGCIGLNALLVCLARGTKKVYVADLSETRLAKAKELGASEIINSGKEDLVQRIMELTSGKGVSVVFETAGSPITAGVTPDLVGKGGKIVMVGNIHAPVSMDFFKLNFKEADIILTFRYCNDYMAAIEGVASGRIPVEKLVTNKFDFEQTEEAFLTAYEKADTAVKVVIEV